MNIELSDRQIGKNVAQMRETAGLSMDAMAPHHPRAATR